MKPCYSKYNMVVITDKSFYTALGGRCKFETLQYEIAAKTICFVFTNKNVSSVFCTLVHHQIISLIISSHTVLRVKTCLPQEKLQI